MKITITESRASSYDNLCRTFLHNESKWFSHRENLVIYAFDTTRELFLEKFPQFILKSYPNQDIDRKTSIFHQQSDIYKIFS